MITAIRYIESSEYVPLFGAPLVRALRVFYDLPVALVRNRVDEALRAGVTDVAPSDLLGLESGSIREEVLERLYSPEALERAFVGTEEVPTRRAAV